MTFEASVSLGLGFMNVRLSIGKFAQNRVDLAMHVKFEYCLVAYAGLFIDYMWYLMYHSMYLTG